MKTSIFIFVLSLFFILGFYGNSFASTPQLVSQSRPLGGFRGDFQREAEYPAGSNVIGSAGTSGRGAMSLGTGISIMNFKRQGNYPSKDMYIVPFSFSYGLTDKLDVSIALPFMQHDIEGHQTQSGYADIMLGTNYHYLGFFQDSIKSQLSVSVILPTGKDNVTSTLYFDGEVMEISNKTDLIISNYISRKIGTRMQLDFALTYILVELSTDNAVLNYGVSLSRGWSNNFSSSLELSGSNNEDPFAKKNNYTVFIGNRYSIPKTSLSIGLVYGTNVFSTYLKQSINTSLSYSF